MSYCTVVISYPYYISTPAMIFLNYLKYKLECQGLGNPVMCYEDWLHRERND
jgi:hypothetical protein